MNSAPSVPTRLLLPELPTMEEAGVADYQLVDSQGATEGTVKNLTGKGARLVMESTIAVPDTFALRFEDGTMHGCAVRWRKVSELGVSFES